MTKFKLVTDFQPQGDQPQAIEKLSEGIEKGLRHQVLLGVTGSGKTFTMANVVERVQRPTIVISHNKTLAAQLFTEFKTLFARECDPLLRELLRLLPAGGLCCADRHVH